jgi:two-component system response regulator HydG
MSVHANILIADDDKEATEDLAKRLQREGHACTAVTDVDTALNLLETESFDVLVVSAGLEERRGMEILDTAAELNPAPQIVAITGRPSAAEAVQAMQHGALSYLQKPVSPAEVVALVAQATEKAALAEDNRQLRRQLAERYGFANMIGTSARMLRVFDMITKIAPTSATVLIQGETGTGKELAARAIHYLSPRRSGRFVPLNCAGLVETILESELFGHEKGAFTGATSQRIGLFEYANHGTVFLDEIGDMPVSSQVKLLRVLEHGEVTRVGSNEPVKIDVRLVAATNQDLLRLVEEGSFRRDLFYRLNVVSVGLPPLREREGDIALLANHFVQEFSEAHDRHVSGLSVEARRLLFRYSWPGNVRELRNCIEHMVVVTTDDILGEDDLPDYMMASLGRMQALPPAVPGAGMPLEEVEKEHIRRTLELVEGNREKAAELLGIGERTLYRKIEKYDLK